MSVKSRDELNEELYDNAVKNQNRAIRLRDRRDDISKILANTPENEGKLLKFKLKKINKK